MDPLSAGALFDGSYAPAVGGGRPETATVLFTDVVDSTAWRVRVGDATADARMAELERTSRDVVAAHDGAVVKGLGDGVMARFGSAVTALDAAADLQDVACRLAWAGAGMHLRVGVSSGDMVREGDDWYGTAAIEASRLCAEAEGGTVLVSATTVQLARGRVGNEVRSRGERCLRGFDTAIEVYELVWQTDDVALPRVLADVAIATMVGRRAELAEAHAVLDAVAGGASRTLLVVGEPGIGKTCLVAAVAQKASSMGFTVLGGRCDEGLRAPYQPVVEALGAWLDACPDVALDRVLGPNGTELVRWWPELGRRLPSLSGPTAEEPAVQRWRLFEAIAALVRSVAVERPLLLVIDDMQWAEPSTLLLLGYLIKAAVARVALVATTRDEQEGDAVSRLGDIGTGRRVDVLSLGGLDRDDVARLVGSTAGERPPDALTHQLKEQTDGNPFFLGAVLAHLDDVGLLRGADGGWVTPAQLDMAGIPIGVRAVIGRRLARLDPAARQALEVAAVTGQVFAESTVRGVLDVDVDLAVSSLDDAARAGLVREQEAGHLVFAHALVRHTVLDGLSRTRLARLHWLVAAQLERAAADASHAGEIAYHYAAGLAVGDAKTVVRTALTAGDDAMQRVAFEEAVHHYGVALDSLALMVPDPDLRYRILTSQAEALNLLAAPDAALPRWLEAAEIARQARDPERLFAAVAGYSYMIRIDFDPDFVRLLDEVLDLLPAGDSPLRARVLSWKAGTFDSFENDGDRRLATEALAMARRAGDPDAIAAALMATLWVESCGPDNQTMLATAHEVCSLVDGGDDAMRAHHFDGVRWLAQALLRAGRRAEAQHHLADYREFVMAHGRRLAAHNGLLLEAAIALADGRFADGKRLAAEATEYGGRHNPLIALAYSAQILAARMEQGRVEEAIAGLRGLGEHIGPAWRAMLAGALADAGEYEQAAAELAELTAGGLQSLPHDFTVALAVRYLPEACRALGDVAVAHELLPLVTPWTGQLLVVTVGTSIEGASDRSIGHLLATVGRFDEAARAYSEGARLERSAGFSSFAIRTDYWHARTLLDRDAVGDRLRARQLLDDVVTVADQLGMHRLAQQAHALLDTT